MLRVHGLFGHIQRNNAKTLALLALFLVLLEATQIAVRLLPMAMFTRLAPQLPSNFEGTFAIDGKTGERHERAAPEPEVQDGTKLVQFKPLRLQAKGTGISGVWENFKKDTTFFERDWYLIPIIGLVFVMASCWWSGLLMRYETRAKPLARKDAPDLYNLVENLALSIGLSCPRIEVIEDPALNAYAAGFFPASSTIAVTRGLIRNLSRDELEAVLAHELVHIRDRDVRLLVMARACVDLVLPMTRSAIEHAKAHPFLTGYAGILLLLYLGPGFALMFAAIFLLITVLAFGVRFAISRTREFTADAGAIELTKNPAALVTALRKVSASEMLPVNGYAARAMMFSAPPMAFLATHPTLEERIAAIKLHTGIGEHEIPDARLPRTVAAAMAAGPVPAFGRKRVLQGLAGDVPVTTATSAARVTPAAAVSAAPPAFGRLPVRTSNSKSASPGQRPIAEPLARGGVEQPDLNQDWIGRWIASGRVDRITGGVLKVFLVPHMLAAYIGMFGMAVAFVVSLSMFNPLLGLAAAAFIAWFAWKRLMKWVRSLFRRLAAHAS